MLMANTLLLDPLTWDLMADANGNIAVAQEPYSLAQDAASAILAFLGEVYYDTTQGVQWTQAILGGLVNLPFIRQQLETAAETVPGVESAQVFFLAIVDRTVSGQVQVTSSSGVVSTASFSRTLPAISPLPFGQ